MASPFLGEIRMFAGNFAPLNWALCNGQVMSIAENDALYTLLGTIYGGDGSETFALPDLRGRIPIHQGTGPGLSTRVIGTMAGSETVTLTQNQMPSHPHAFMANTAQATSDAPAGNVPAAGVGINLFAPAAQDTALAPAAVTTAGGGQSHDNMMPTLCVNFIISLFGVFPSQS